MDVILSVQSIKYPLTGIGRYTYELARHLPHLDEVQALRFFDGEKFIGDLPEPGSLSSEESVRVSAGGPVYKLKRYLARSQCWWIPIAS